MKKLLIYIKFKMGMLKIKNGKIYEFISNVKGKVSSGYNVSPNHGDNGKIYVMIDGHRDTSVHGQLYNVSQVSKNGKVIGPTNGWVYEHELKSLKLTGNEIKDSIIANKELIAELEADNKLLETKLEFMETQGIKQFNDDDFKAYLVLKELGIDDFKKAQNIVKILGK